MAIDWLVYWNNLPPTTKLLIFYQPIMGFEYNIIQFKFNSFSLIFGSQFLFMLMTASSRKYNLCIKFVLTVLKGSSLCLLLGVLRSCVCC